MEEQTGQISPLTVLFSAAFTIWMLVDAWKRRVPLYWYFIIVVMPFGAVFYFAFVKLRDYRNNVGRPSWSPTSSTRQPAPAPAPVEGPADLDRADALEAQDQYLEAEPMYRAALELDPTSKRALHGYARCLLGLGKIKESLVQFEKLLELDREYANFGAALDYADALWAADQRNDAVELLEGLCATTGRINHHLALGHYLAEFGQIERAKHEIEQALARASGPAAPYTDRQRQWVTRGRQMLAELYERYPEAPGNDS